MKILVIDDDPLSLSGLKMMLEQQGGHEIAAFQNPVEAVKEYQAGQYDAVITDNRMPEMTGLEVARRIKEINPAAEVIMISGHEIQAVEKEGIGKWCCCFFAKPLRAGTVLEALHKILRQHLNNHK